MCREMERIYNDGKAAGEAAGEAAGAKKEKIRTAMSMIDDGFPTATVVKHSRLTASEVRLLQERKKRQDSLQPA